MVAHLLFNGVGSPPLSVQAGNWQIEQEIRRRERRRERRRAEHWLGHGNDPNHTHSATAARAAIPIEPAHPPIHQAGVNR